MTKVHHASLNAREPTCLEPGVHPAFLTSRWDLVSCGACQASRKEVEDRLTTLVLGAPADPPNGIVLESCAGWRTPFAKAIFGKPVPIPMAFASIPCTHEAIGEFVNKGSKITSHLPLCAEHFHLTMRVVGNPGEWIPYPMKILEVHRFGTVAVRFV